MKGEVKLTLSLKIAKLIICLTLLALPLVIAVSVHNTKAGGILDTKHDFTRASLTSKYPRGPCTVCHTPHKSPDIRLWPRASSGWDFGEPPITASSKVCLDCHGYSLDTVPLYDDLPDIDGANWGGIGWTPKQVYDNAGVYKYLNHAGGIDKDCTKCHPHHKGMVPEGCNLCHGFPPGFDDIRISGERLGSVENVPGSIDDDEAGAHLLHTKENTTNSSIPLEYNGQGDIADNKGYPKLGGFCTACHMRWSDDPVFGEGPTGHDGKPDEPNKDDPPDDAGEVDFDILDELTRYPTITKDANGLNTAVGDEIRDRNIENTDDTGAVLGLPPGSNGGTSKCVNIYCHSTVIMQATADPWISPVENLPIGLVYPVWNDDTSVKCGSCHEDSVGALDDYDDDGVADGLAVGHIGNKMTNKSHAKHVTYDTTYKTYKIYCTDCHLGKGKTDAASTEFHVDGKTQLNVSITDYAGIVGLNITTTYYNTGGGIDDENLPGGLIGFGQCDNVYCHSGGDEVKKFSGPPDPLVLRYAQPTWGAALTCESCHGTYYFDPAAENIPDGAPDYDNGGAGATYANSHAAHVRGGVPCKRCHYTSIDPDSADDDPTIWYDRVAPDVHTHVNGIIEINSELQGDFNGYKKEAATENDDVKRCYDTGPCHGTYDPVTEWLNAPQWGGTADCFTCHGGTEPAVRPIEPPGEPAIMPPNKVNKDEYITSGHGLPTGSYYPPGSANGGNPGAGFEDYTSALLLPGCMSRNASNPQLPTEGCHFAGSAHTTKSATDPYRLGDYYTITSDVDGFCKYCHMGDIFVEAETHTKTTTGSVLNWDGGNGGANTWETNPPKCVDCHDPHGDSNDYMIRDSIAYMTGSTVYGSPTGAMKPVSFNLTGAGLAGDYYDVDIITPGTDGICQVCHTQNLVYNNIAVGILDGEVKTHRNNLDAADNIIDFLPDTSPRICTSCHFHYGGAGPPMKDYGFKIPSLTLAENDGANCTDCHMWNPDGDPTHPLMVSKSADPILNAGGLLDGLSVTNDDNDDVDNYTFGSQPGWITGPPDIPQIADYSDRGMIDTAQWFTAGHGMSVANYLPETALDGGVDIDAGPGLGCVSTGLNKVDGGCHVYDDSVPNGAAHGLPADPFRIVGLSNASGKEIIVYVCKGCHYKGNKSKNTKPANHNAANLYPDGICTDCHDPHGDTMNTDAYATSASISDSNINAAMMQREVVWRNRWLEDASGEPLANWGDPTFFEAPDTEDKLEPSARYYITSPGAPAASDFAVHNDNYSAICEACHRADTTPDPPGPRTMWFRRNNDDGVTPASGYHIESCTDCHLHPAGFQRGQMDGNPDCMTGCHFPDIKTANNDDIDDWLYGNGTVICLRLLKV
jgi:predicted CxxxxCH...CXXCH cytochrome family protein